MKFAFGTLVCLAAALIPAAQASVDITFSAEKFNRRDDQPQRNPEFGLLLANQYIKHNGAGMPEPKDIRDVYRECKWRSYNKQLAWLDENNVSCYLSPSYRYQAVSIAKAFDASKSYKAGACGDTADTPDYPDHLPRFTISVPYLYFNNLYDRRCKVRALVQVPKTDEHDSYWVQAWVQDHNGGYWDKTGKENPKGPQDGILIDTKLYPEFFNKNEKDPDFKGVTPVRWFFLDINTQG